MMNLSLKFMAQLATLLTILALELIKIEPSKKVVTEEYHFTIRHLQDIIMSILLEQLVDIYTKSRYMGNRFLILNLQPLVLVRLWARQLILLI